jgi:mono/diheme cytochrome c family protein
MRVWLIVGILGSASGLAAVGATEPASAALDRFEKKVRPLLAARCWQCHGAAKSKGGLRLDTAEAIVAGGDSGPAVVAGKPGESRLIEAIGYAGELKMPPKGKLSDAEIAELTAWVGAGAVWPDNGPRRPLTTVAQTAGGPLFTEEQKSFWAFRPPRDPLVPDVKASGWPTSPLDRFILAELERNGLTPAPAADKRTLIRRATFDVTGLPPTAEEVEAFINDRSPEAFVKVVDRLLASPQYGERWARHWLDLARYADSNGMDENMAYAHAFRYRDYVVRAFNADKPYDHFVTEQIAGDLLPPAAREAINHDRITATGFLVIGPKMLAEDDPMKMEMDIIDEQVDTVGRVFMGLTIGCARCHDHKFDPIPTADYYAMAGIFKSTKSMQNHKVVAMWNERALATDEERDRLSAHKKEVARREAEIKALAKKPASKTRDDELRRLRDSLAELRKQAPPVAEVMSVEDQAVTNLRIHIRGNHMTLGDLVPRQFLRILAGENQPPLESSKSGRLELAGWLTGADHPLTARVMVNRLWLWHSGEGLVGSPDNFGRLGDRPVNRDLLDWLARRLVGSGWSIKAMQRLVMLSSTYQMSTRFDPVAAQIDPENRLHWRTSRRRLEAEAIRDAILAVSGELDVRMTGSLMTEQNHAYVNSTTRSGGTAYHVKRRSVYLPVIRSGLYDVFQAFDFADPSASNGKRIPTTVAPQALFMLNDEVVLESSAAMARHLLAQPGLDDAGRIRRAYESAYGRPPTDRESARAVDYLRRFAAVLESQGVGPEARPLKAWQGLCQAIFAASEFIYLN